jgi:glutamate/tyrosine decarboxylase-like PLP-dependent enzyme
VTSISADLHKYGYAGKGASLLLWRSIDAMKYQIFVATDFPGGVYASPTMIGTRPGGPVAAAWAALHSLGEDGYLQLAEQAIAAADRLRAGIIGTPGVALVGDGDATIVSYTGVGIDTYALADRLEARGWTVDRQHRPASIHLTVTANHAGVVDAYLADLRAAVEDVRKEPGLAKQGSAPMYGMAAKMPVRRLVAGQVRKLFTEMYSRPTGDES